jgi:hypothetical protein
MMVIAKCLQDEVNNPFTGEKMQKSEMATYLVLVDMIVVVLFLIYI